MDQPKSCPPSIQSIKDPLVMIVDNSQRVGEEALRLVAFDKLDGDMGSRAIINGKPTLGEAQTNRVDNYLKEFLHAAMPWLLFCQDAGAAMNVILTRDSTEHDRIKSAKYVSSFVPAYEIIRKAMKPLRVVIEVDSRDCTTVWLGIKKKLHGRDAAIKWTSSKGFSVTWNGDCLGINEGKIYMGSGDGYHRAFDDATFVDLANPNCTQEITEMVAEELKRERNQNADNLPG